MNRREFFGKLFARSIAAGLAIKGAVTNGYGSGCSLGKSVWGAKFGDHDDGGFAVPVEFVDHLRAITSNKDKGIWRGQLTRVRVVSPSRVVSSSVEGQMWEHDIFEPGYYEAKA